MQKEKKKATKLKKTKRNHLKKKKIKNLIILILKSLNKKLKRR